MLKTDHANARRKELTDDGAIERHRSSEMRPSKGTRQGLEEIYRCWGRRELKEEGKLTLVCPATLLYGWTGLG